MSTTLNPDYFRCFSFTVPRTYHDQIVIGLSLVLFLDNPYVTDSYYGADGGGAVLVPHYFPRVPSPFLGGHYLASGQHTVLQAKRHVIKRLTEPYGSCIQTEDTHSEFTWRNSSSCLVNMTRQSCNCTEVQHAIFEEPYDVDAFPYCGDVRFFIDWLEEKAKCISQLNSEICPTESRLPCIEHQYPVQTSLIAWPALTEGFEGFYNYYIKGKRGSNIFEPVHDYLKMNCSSENKIECKLFQLQADDLIRKNFLKVSFYLRDKYESVMEEQPKIESVELSSQVGSILNLWSGITMVVIVELFELFYRLIINALCDTLQPKNIPSEKIFVSEKVKECTQL